MRLTVLNIYKLLFLCTVLFQQENVGLPPPKKNGCQLTIYKESDIPQRKNLLSSNFWENDDWVIKESSSLLTRPHFEADFKDFRPKEQNEFVVKFDNKLTSYSFSVKGTNEIKFFAIAGENSTPFHCEINEAEIWTTITIFVKDNKLFYYKSYDTLMHKLLLVPKELMIEPSTPANFKIYEYDFREATRTTKTHNILKIPGSKEVYLIISVSLCNTCVLVITYNYDNCLIVSSNSHNNERWERYKLKINPIISNQVKFNRIQNPPLENGFWRLHLTLTDYSEEADDVVPEARKYDGLTRRGISTSYPSFRDTITFSNISPPTSNDSTKVYFVFTKNGFINSTEEVIAYALILLEVPVDIQGTNRYWDGTFRTWPSIPKNSLQLTPDLWNPFTDEIQTCNFIIGAVNSCCKEYCYNKPLKPNTKYWLIVRALTNKAYNDSSLLSFHTDNIATETTPVYTTILLEASQFNNFTSPTVQKSVSYPLLGDTITFSNISPPTSNDSTKAYFVLSKDDLINSTNEVIAYALILLEEHFDIQSTNGSWEGTFKTWPSIPKNSLQLTPNFWNPFSDDQHICNFIIGANSSCCRVHCYNTPLKPKTRYWLMVRAFTNQAYNDSSLLFFQTASEDSYSVNTSNISLGVLILAILVTVGIVYIIYKIRKRKNQAALIQEEEVEPIIKGQVLGLKKPQRRNTF